MATFYRNEALKFEIIFVIDIKMLDKIRLMLRNYFLILCLWYFLL